MRSRTTTRIRVLSYIRKFVGAHGYGPTVREIRDALDMSGTSVVHSHLNRLERQRLITREPGLARTIRPSPRERPWGR